MAFVTALAALAACSDDGGGKFPAVSSVPGTPPESTQPPARRQIVAALVADRDNAKYTDEELRATPPDLPPPVRVAQRPSPAPMPAPPRPAAPAPAPAMAQAVAPAPAPALATGDDLVAQVFRRAMQQQGSAAPAVYVPTSYASPVAAASAPAPVAAMASPSPIAASALPPPVARPPAVIRFAGNAARLSDADKRVIGEAAERWKARPGPVKVIGFAGGEVEATNADRVLANFRLAGTRADAVAAELRRSGVSAASIVTEARPSSGPAFYVGTQEGQAESRRVEIYVD